jgi:Protein of unknown function (DUF938)
MTKDARLMAPATARNREHITKVLRRHLPSHGLVLEVASGTGEHIVHFAGALSADLTFQPSDPDAAARTSVDAWVESTGVRNVLPAMALDAAADPWPIQRADAVICINMIHIAPWEAAIGLVRGAAHLLPASGPIRRSIAVFACKTQNGAYLISAWGPAPGERRTMETVAELAEDHGFAQPLIEQMPANNLSLIFRRVAPS